MPGTAAAAATAPPPAGTCLACKKEPIGYEAFPCGCKILCKPCAMKAATGGKCKACGLFFEELRHLQNK